MFYAEVSFSAELCQQKHWQMEIKLQSIILWLVAFSANAETTQPYAPYEQNDTIGKRESVKLTGLVQDENKAPIGFVNVILLNSDSTYVAGSITNDDGTFQVVNPGNTAKIIRFSAIGYKKVERTIPTMGNLGTIYI